MGLPAKLKNMNMFVDGESWLGEAAEVTPAKLERDFEDWRSGGMIGPVKWDKGQKPIDLEWKAGGWMRQAMRSWGATAIDAIQARFAGAYEDIGTGRMNLVEIIARGRYEEIDPGKAKPGDDTEQNYKLSCVYYRVEWNGIVDLEVDFLNSVLISGGIDRTAELREILGIF